jgi:peptidoglycan/xylan/chitin deacetylase (PgdA/CDA1 family)
LRKIRGEHTPKSYTRKNLTLRGHKAYLKRTILSNLVPYLDKFRLLDLLAKLKLKDHVLLVIAYHEVGKNTYWNGTVSTRLFEDEIRYLLKLRFRILPLCEALEVIKEEPDKPHRIAVLTFDDAYKGVYENALPIMLKYGVRGTIYPVAGFMERRIANWSSQIGFIVKNIRVPTTIKIIEPINKTFTIKDEYDKNNLLQYFLDILPKLDISEINMVINRLSESISDSSKRSMQQLYEEVMMDSNQLEEMVELGFEVGGHGYWHVGLINISKRRLYQEIEKSLNFVDKFMSISTCKIRTFAYPYGLYNDEVINVLKEVGFHAAVSTKFGINKILRLKQYEINRIPSCIYGIKSLGIFKVVFLRYL